MKIELNEKEIISKYSKEKQSVSQIAADYHVARKRVKEMKANLLKIIKEGRFVFFVLQSWFFAVELR